MKKIKEHNFVFKSGNITIRTIKNSDIEFYKNWYKEGHILKEAVNSISNDEIERMIYLDSKILYIFIIEIEGNNCGEISVTKDTSVIVRNNEYIKPFYSIWMNIYNDISDTEIVTVLSNFIISLKTSKLKINTLLTMIYTDDEKKYEEYYLKCNFKEIRRENYKTKMEKFFSKKGIENPYYKSKILMRKV